jgi:hypothetical protein
VTPKHNFLYNNGYCLPEKWLKNNTDLAVFHALQYEYLAISNIFRKVKGTGHP